MSVIVMRLENLSEYFSSEVAFQNAPKLILSSESCLLPWKQKKKRLLPGSKQLYRDINKQIKKEILNK